MYVSLDTKRFHMKLKYICLYIHLSLTVMEDVSVKLYKYMCDKVVGSEKVVNYRRQFFNVFDDVLNHCGNNGLHIISSGSKAEGLDLPGSDFDVMYVNKNIHGEKKINIFYKLHLCQQTFLSNVSFYSQAET